MYSSEWKNLVSSFGYGFVDDLEQYKNIVKVRAYSDMQPRTIGGLGDFRKQPVNNTSLNRLFDNLAETLYSFVIKESVKAEQEYDEWHKEKCNWFVNEFNNMISGKGVDPIAFGKAQKIINVSLKYIYCLKDAEKYNEKFEHCHMILDRYTYSEGFYKLEVIPWLNRTSSKNLKLIGLTSWSNLDYNEYAAIQSNVRDFLKSSDEYVTAQGTHLTPFQSEFYIFSKYNK